MPRSKKAYVCRECGYSSPGWLGRCPGCGAWNTIEEEAIDPPGLRTAVPRGAGGPVAAPAPLRLSDIDISSGERISTGLEEFDRVLGGGLVPGSLVLVGGEPGIGKSTLLLQALLRMEARGVDALLVSGEESAAQVKVRSLRLGGTHSALPLVTQTQVEQLVAALLEARPAVCVIDSVQTLWSAQVGSTPGSMAQIREVTSQLLGAAKEYGIALLLVGHVTKDGELAGPRVLEHMVDAVLSFEGDRAQPFRVLRAVKNRFGSTNEIGVFEMGERGLLEVADPVSVFLEEGDLRSGSVVVPVLEGSRCLLAEVQALVVPSGLPVPQRVARGVDRNRLAMIVAVLTRRARLRLLQSDIFVNVAGGLVLEDPAADLAVALAIATACRDQDGDGGLAAFGEVSLTGKVRYALQGDRRLRELSRRGFDRIVVPQRNAQEYAGAAGQAAGQEKGKATVRIEPVLDIAQAVAYTAARSSSG